VLRYSNVEETFHICIHNFLECIFKSANLYLRSKTNHDTMYIDYIVTLPFNIFSSPHVFNFKAPQFNKLFMAGSRAAINDESCKQSQRRNPTLYQSSIGSYCCNYIVALMKC
jgi:hypothetical protein